jgi:hypothetical protein
MEIRKLKHKSSGRKPQNRLIKSVHVPSPTLRLGSLFRLRLGSLFNTAS